MPSLSSIRAAAGSRISLTGRPGLTRTRVPDPVPVPFSTHVVDCAVYQHGVRLPGRWSHDDAIREARALEDSFVWIGLHEPDLEQIQGIAEEFGLHELAVEDAVHAHNRPKLERYEETLFAVFKTVCYVGHAEPTTASELVETGEVMAFIGHDFVVTVRHGNHTGLHEVRVRLENDPEHLALGPATVLHAVADHVVDSYIEVTDAIEDDIDVMERTVFEPRSAVDSEQIYVMKREVLELRRAVMPLGPPLRRLAEGYSSLVPHEVRSYFRDVDDHLTTVAERVTGFDELLTTLVDAVLAKISLRQNDDMRKITAWAAIISVPTMLTGIYGMNFDHMPELHWSMGYYAVMLVILSTCGLLYRTFRRNKWL